MKPNQRMLETHPYIAENHMTPSPNLHLCSIMHLFSLFSAMKPKFCTPPGGEVDYRDRIDLSLFEYLSRKPRFAVSLLIDTPSSLFFLFLLICWNRSATLVNIGPQN